MDWKDYVNEVETKGFWKASPLARLVWSCEVGKIDQHASDDLMAISDELQAQAEVVALARFIVNNKQNFLTRDTDGQAEATLDALAAALKKLGG